MPAWGRWLLRNLLILPFRAPRTARQYETIWLAEGSPLQVYTRRLLDSLQASLESEHLLIRVGMAYSEPRINEAMVELEQAGVTDILVIPLFPQYSTATTASVFHAVKESAARWQSAPRLEFLDALHDDAAFIRAWTILITRHLPQADNASAVEHVVFSYHGLPESNIRKADKQDYCRFGVCCAVLDDRNRQCYRAQCMATTRAIVDALGWSDEFYSVAFQSRFGKQAWIQPYLSDHIESLARQGIKRIAVITPSFVSDCLETLHEIGIEYREQFIECGGESLLLIPNLNDDIAWFSAMKEIIRRHLPRLG